MKNRLHGKMMMQFCLLGFATAFLAGCGADGFNALDAPNEDNVKLLRGEFSDEGGGSSTGGGGLEERLEASWATLNVSVALDGSPPSPQQLLVEKDLTTCKPGGKPVFNNAIDIGDDKSVGNVLLYMSSDLPVDDSDSETPLWVHSRYADGRSDELLFDQQQCLFLSPVFAMRSSQSLIVKNSDRIGHNTKLNTKRATPLNVTIEGGDKVSYQPGAQERQPIQVECSVHPWMKAFMIMRDNPYFGVSEVKKNGRFSVADIPAGVELEYRIWVVGDFAAGGTTSITLDGKQVEIKRGGKIKLNLAASDTPHELKISVNSSAFGS